MSTRAQMLLYSFFGIVGLGCVIIGSYRLGYDEGYILKESELKECAEEVSSGCPNVTTYAVMLEKENARLNKVCKRKTQKVTD